MNDSKLEAAQGYAARGWAVVPIIQGTKIPATPHGKDDASTDPDIIAGWFGPGSTNGVAILTGERSGLLVVDIDPRNGGWEGFAEMEARYGALPPTMSVATGGGGRHLYFQLPAEFEGTRDRINVDGFQGVDLKCGGYVVAPPSLHPNGVSYEWE